MVPSAVPRRDSDATAVMMRPSEEDWAAHRAGRLPPAAGAPPPSARPSRLAAAEWYVGIDGEPVGPIDVGYLKTQIARGKVGIASLVWREELPDWKPLESFPELRDLVASEQPLVPPAKVSAPIALTRATEEGASPSPIHNESFAEPEPQVKPAVAAPAPAVPAVGVTPSAGVPVAAVPPAAATIPMADAATGSLAPAVQPAADLAAAAASPPAAPAAGKPRMDLESGASGDAWPFGEHKPVPSEPLPDSEVLAAAGVRPRKRSKMHPMAWALIAMTTAFGAVSAWFIFGEEDPQALAARNGTGGASARGGGGGSPGSVATGAKPNASGQVVTVDGVDIGPDAGNGAPFPMATGSRKATEPAASSGKTTKPPKPCTPDDPFCDNKQVEGPTKTGSSSSSSGSGQGLSQSQAQTVVSRYRGSLMRRCRALVTKGSAKVAATIVVGSSGAVQSVSASGGKEYPGLASCVRSRIANWSFPASGASTTINVSFNFL